MAILREKKETLFVIVIKTIAHLVKKILLPIAHLKKKILLPIAHLVKKIVLPIAHLIKKILLPIIAYINFFISQDFNPIDHRTFTGTKLNLHITMNIRRF
jgi:hypothetical protein